MADTLTIRIPAELRRELDRIGRAEGLPAGTLVRRWLHRSVEEWKLEQVYRVTRAAARAAGYHSEEDILNIPS